MEDFLRIDFDNDPVEVRKLQVFLRDFEDFNNLEVTGVFDQATFDAVSEFQERYSQDVLLPWGLTSSTGYVYLTTRKKINEIYCQKEFPLTEEQLAEIEGFKNRLASISSDNTSFIASEENNSSSPEENQNEVTPLVGFNDDSGNNSKNSLVQDESIDNIQENSNLAQNDQESQKPTGVANILTSFGKIFINGIKNLFSLIF